MTSTSFRDRVEVVLREELRCYRARGRRTGGLGSLNIGTQSEPNSGWTTEGSVPTLLFAESKAGFVTSPNLATALALYSALDAAEKELFRDFLLRQLHSSSDFSAIAYFLFLLLHRLGSTVEGLATAAKNLAGAGAPDHAYSNILATLSMLISREYREIPTQTYDEINGLLADGTEPDFRLKEKINLALLRHLESSLNDINPEINADRDKIVSIWSDRFPGSRVPIIIKEIEGHFEEGELSETRYATCIGRIRVLLKEVACTMLAALDDEPGERGDEAAMFQQLRSRGRISDAEWNILRSLFALASRLEEGTG